MTKYDILITAAPGKPGDDPSPLKARPGGPPHRPIDGTYTPGRHWWDQGTCQCAPPGAEGEPGHDAKLAATTGKPGGSAPTFALMVARLASDVAVHSQGGRGGKGGKGQDGGDGGAGQDAGTNDPKCNTSNDPERDPCCSAVLGGVGGAAGNGANAGEGGRGGDGGDIYIYYTQPQVPVGGVVYQLLSTSEYGLGGPAGDVGIAGKPGKGGKNGQEDPPHADPGHAGRDGLPNSPGQIGTAGQVHVDHLYTD